MTAPNPTDHGANPLASWWIIRHKRTIDLILLAVPLFLIVNSALSLAELPAPLPSWRPLQMLMLSSGMFTSMASSSWMRRTGAMSYLLWVVAMSLIIGSLFVER